MRFMSIVKVRTEAPPTPELFAAIGKISEQAIREGTLVGMGGLLPLATGASVRAAGGKVVVTDGPFIESKEIIGGYAIFELPTKEAAVEKARQFMQVHVDVLGANFEGECEVRPMYEAGEDCKSAQSAA